MVLAPVLFGALLLSIGLTFACAGVCVFLKGEGKRTAVNVLLTLATCVVLLQNLSVTLLPKKMEARSKGLKADFVQRVDQSAQLIVGCSYLDKLKQPLLQTVAWVDEIPSSQEALKQAEKELRWYQSKHQADADLTARLAILLYNNSDNVQEIFAQYEKSGAPANALVDTLREMYAKEAPTQHQDEWIDVIGKALPPGWYQDRAIAYALQSSPKKLAAFTQAQEEKRLAWTDGYVVYAWLTLIFSLAAIGTMASWTMAWLKSRTAGSGAGDGSHAESTKALADTNPTMLDFQKVYGCLITVLFVQTIYDILTDTVFHEFKVMLTDTAFHEFRAGVGLIPILSTSLSSYFFVCLPAKISFAQLFLRGGKVKAWQFALTCGHGFCVVFFINLIVRVIVRFVPLPHWSQFVTYVVGDQGYVTLLYVILVCLICPVTEEVLFRGLAYQWVRQRWGMIAALLISSLVFAAWHRILNGFGQLFGLGLVLGYYYERTRNLPTTACIHALWNIWVIFCLPGCA